MGSRQVAMVQIEVVRINSWEPRVQWQECIIFGGGIFVRFPSETNAVKRRNYSCFLRCIQLLKTDLEILFYIRYLDDAFNVESLDSCPSQRKYMVAGSGIAFLHFFGLFFLSYLSDRVLKFVNESIISPNITYCTLFQSVIFSGL